MSTLSLPTGLAGTRRQPGRRRRDRSPSPAPHLYLHAALRLLAIAALAGTGALLVWSAVPVIWGWTPAVVVSGSMSPALHRGDVAVTSVPPANWKPAIGQVVVVPDPQHPGNTRIHRIVGIGEGGLLITRGDANGSDDSFRTAPEQVKGIGRLLIPRIALGALQLQEGRPVLFVLQSAAVMAAFALALRAPRPGNRRRRDRI